MSNRAERRADTRIAYGARCSWWGSIHETARHSPSGLPGCPFCFGPLFECPSEKEWWKGVDHYTATKDAGYRKFIEWVRGRCIPSTKPHHPLQAARLRYEQELKAVQVTE